MVMSLVSDIRTVFKKDPAACSVIEVLLCYPGLHALWMHRLSHALFRMRLCTLARIISHVARWMTGIEIHPGARIGKDFFIDHGMGVVIGETTEIGDNCLIYQGVVLGGTSLNKEKRHPTLGNNVVIGAGAIVLGPVTLGNNAKVGAGSVVIHDVPDGATAVGVPARSRIDLRDQTQTMLEHGNIPDPVRDAIDVVLREVENIEKRLKKIETMEGVTGKLDEYFEKKKKEIHDEFKRL
ncbi:MAG: serine O-acetyltransferase [Elusimicrobia bacterium]|nr:serine O-acetyltransferase [Elusimicrobiota bacterium]MBD3412075.1 serine O-acetyltransferase [Elusimicrobiota bacterium]